MSLQSNDTKLILASQSNARAQILRGAGLVFDIMPAHLDEDVFKHNMRSPEATAQELAVAKALAISAHHPDALIIGADQMMACEGRCFDKPENMEEVRDNLNFLSGKTHALLSGVALAKDGVQIWATVEIARLHMRTLSADVLDAYLAQADETVLTSVGCYQLEDIGGHLFDKIEGDYFTILGLPLLQLLAQLRILGIVK